MSEFYRQLKTAPIKAEALQQTQIAMITKKIQYEKGQIISPRGHIPLPENHINPLDFSHPFYWAAFNLIGSPW